MALDIPTTQEIKDRNLAALELSLGQDAPINLKAFLRVLSAMEAYNHTELYKFGVERALQNLAITATGSDLDTIGAEYSTLRKQAESTVLTITLPGVNGTTIPAKTGFIGDSNGIRYFSDASVVIAAGIGTISATSETPGVAGNMNVSDTLTISTQIAGAESVATVTVITNTGADQETDSSYRPRILIAIRSVTGGANAVDYKIWAEEVAGCKVAYPYAGKAFGSVLTSYPGDRSVYIEAEASVDPDGIAPPSLLADCRTAIGTDPVTGLARPPLGIIDSTLYLISIIRTPFYVQITQLVVDATIEAATKTQISIALDAYFTGISMFVEGVDLAQDRNDIITDLSVSKVVQDVLDSVGASASGVGFSEIPATFVPVYALDPGELGKLGTVTYV